MLLSQAAYKARQIRCAREGKCRLSTQSLNCPISASELLEALPNLHTFELPGASDLETLTSIATHPKLEIVVIIVRRDDINILGNTFPKLTRFDGDFWSLAGAIGLFSRARSSMLDYFQIQVQTFPPSQLMQNFCAMLAGLPSWSSLRILRVTFDQEHMGPPESDLSLELGSASLKPLLLLCNMERLTIKSPYLNPCDGIIRSMALAWPNLTHLHLIPEFPRMPLPVLRPSLTLGALCSLGKHCHSLRSLDLVLDGTIQPRECTAREHRGKQLGGLHLQTGFSYMSDDPTDIRAAASALRRIFPTLRSHGVGSREGDPRLSPEGMMTWKREMGRRKQAWLEVKKRVGLAEVVSD